MTSLPLFDQVFSGKPTPPRRRLTGEDRKKSGMDSVMKHTPQWYVDAFRVAVESFPRGKTFTVEDIREVVGDPPDSVSGNCMGPLMTMLARKKLAKKTGFYVHAKRECMNGTDLACWVRL